MQLYFVAIEGDYFFDTGEDGVGFVEYLQAAEGGEALALETRTQIEAVYDAFDALPTNKTLADMIEEDMNAVSNLHTEVEALSRFFKTEIPALLNITI